MIVHFGLQFDGLQAARAATAVGELSAGPLRLLGVLETQLGLPAVTDRPGEAVLAYQACLADCDTPARFYHRSFGVDALGVARTLGAWRAQWHEAGWRGEFGGPVSARLRDLADVERVAADRVPLTPGQRIQRVQAALSAGLRTQIERIVVHDPLPDLPAAWRGVLAHFEHAEAPGTAPQGWARPGSDLHRVQQALLASVTDHPGAPSARSALAGDDSIVILRGVSRDLSAQVVGEFLREHAAFTDTVVIAERDGIILDNAFERVGLPRAGFQHGSRFRAVTQVLKLCMGLVWEPVSPQLLLQFLIHPVAPLPDATRSRLAEAVAESPGIGGPAWQAALEAIAARRRERFAARDADLAAHQREIEDWLECARFPASPGAPVTALIPRAQRVATWLAAQLRLHTDAGEIALYAAALGQAEALLRALAGLRDQGQNRISRLAFERLVDEVSGHAPDPAVFAEAGHVSAVTDPAAVTAARHTVIWWDLAAPGLGVRLPWSNAELAELAAEGVAIPSAVTRIAQRSRAWQRPVLNARERLVLVVHDRDEGPHPLLSLLSSLFEQVKETRVEDVLLGAADARADNALGVPTEPLPRCALPAPRRWWQLPEGVRPPPRPRESYSSLERLIDTPHAWVLDYAARLRRGRAADLPSGSLLYGRLAHRLFEQFFLQHTDWPALPASALEAWTAATLPMLVDQEAAALRAPGAGIEHARVLARLEQALARLLEHLRSAGIERVEAEHWDQAPFQGLSLRGGIDLLLTRRDGREVVLDVKWSGERYRAAQLAAQRALQLATYARLREHATGRWPDTAYFIVTSGNLLAPDTSVFAEAVPCGPAPMAMDALWHSVETTVAWRRAQLAAGMIEVNVPGTAPTAESVPPPDAFPTDAQPSRFDDFLWLTGWEPDA